MDQSTICHDPNEENVLWPWDMQSLEGACRLSHRYQQVPQVEPFQVTSTTLGSFGRSPCFPKPTQRRRPQDVPGKVTVFEGSFEAGWTGKVLDRGTEVCHHYRLEAIAMRLEAIPMTMEAISIRLEAILI